MSQAEELLVDLARALDNAFISSWQSTAAWNKQLEAALAYIREKNLPRKMGSNEEWQRKAWHAALAAVKGDVEAVGYVTAAGLQMLKDGGWAHIKTLKGMPFVEPLYRHPRAESQSDGEMLVWIEEHGTPPFNPLKNSYWNAVSKEYDCSTLRDAIRAMRKERMGS